jgi:hypothetical protein
MPVLDDEMINILELHDNTAQLQFFNSMNIWPLIQGLTSSQISYNDRISRIKCKRFEITLCEIETVSADFKSAILLIKIIA